MALGGDIRNPISDHGDLQGLSDDDHSQYSLVDGSRAFTDTVGGITPVDDADLATKLYVDDQFAGATTISDFKDSVRVATTAEITLSGTQTIDGISLSGGDRVLVKDQDDQTENGIYEVASGAWSRSSDADEDAEVNQGMFTAATGGDENQNKGFLLVTDDPITLGTSDLIFREIVPRREQITANRQYFVRTDGDDNNDGLSDSSSGAFLTIQKAIDVVSSLDLSIFNVTINIGNGTYTGANTLKSLVGFGPVTIVGDESTPSNVVISTTSNHCFNASVFTGVYQIRGVKMQTTTSGNCINMGATGRVNIGDIDFGSCAGSHMFIANDAILGFTGDYSITGGAVNHMNVQNGGAFPFGRTVTLTGTPAFSNIFAFSNRNGVIDAFSMTFSGSATGKRYQADSLGLIFTNGGGANYFPGDSAGSTSGGGQYV